MFFRKPGTLNIKIMILLYTTALVLDLPTEIAPPLAWYPKYDDTDETINAKNKVLIIAYDI